MQVEQKVNIHNRFDVEVNGEWVGFAENIVLNQMWDRLCAGSSYFVNIHFGTGSGTPIASRTTLFTHLGTKAAVDVEQIKALPISSWKRKVVLNPEEFVGSTITEVGIAFGTTNTNLVTHAMLKDAEGNPISITKTDTDVITIYATVFINITTTSNLKMLDMPSNNQLVNYLVGGAAAPTGLFMLYPFVNAYVAYGSTSTVVWTSDVPNKKRKTNIPRFDIATGNGHVKHLQFTNLFNLELPAPGIFTGQPYTAVPVGTGDGVKTKFTLPSANINQATLAMKIAGAVVNNYTKRIFNSNLIRIKAVDSNPFSMAFDVALTPDGLVMAVGGYSGDSIYVYDWGDDGWVKRTRPAVLPPGTIRGVVLTPDGLIMAVAHDSSPYVTTYDWVGGAWVKRPNPAVLPTGNGYAVELTPDGLIMAVGNDSPPYVTTYDWVGGAWVKRPDPTSPPPSTGRGVSFTPDGLIMAVGNDSPPYVTTYDWFGGAWVKRPNPASLPPDIVRRVKLTPDGLIMAVSHHTSPFITTYDWFGGVWVKRPNPAVLPTSTGYGVALTPDGLIMAVAHDSSPYVTTYDWFGGAWVKRPDPTSLPNGGSGVALTPDGLVMAVTSISAPYIFTYKALPFTEVTFDTPVAAAQAITADYTVDGLHKTNQYVVDVSFSIQFGEGV